LSIPDQRPCANPSDSTRRVLHSNNFHPLHGGRVIETQRNELGIYKPDTTNALFL
jgi:hypothetical protein